MSRLTRYLMLALVAASTTIGAASATTVHAQAGCNDGQTVGATISLGGVKSGTGSGTVTAGGTTVSYTYALDTPIDNVTVGGSVTSGPLLVGAVIVQYTGGDGEALESSVITGGVATFNVVVPAQLIASGSVYENIIIVLVDCSGGTTTTVAEPTTTSGSNSTVTPTTSGGVSSGGVLPETGRNLNTTIAALVATLAGAGLILIARRGRPA